MRVRIPRWFSMSLLKSWRLRMAICALLRTMINRSIAGEGQSLLICCSFRRHIPELLLFLWNRIIGHRKILWIQRISSFDVTNIGMRKICLHTMRKVILSICGRWPNIAIRQNIWYRKFRRRRIYPRWLYCIGTTLPPFR
ncbi:hypothetical protein D3C75_786320 [compost metagenome]